MSEEKKYSPGVERYIQQAKLYLAQQEEIKSRMQKMKFETIAVHGLYSLEEALERNQGAIVEPLYLAASQGYKDADELEAALAYLIPTWCYTRIANPTTYYLEYVLALLEGYKTGYDTSCVVTASGMSAIMMAV
ncbi:MAG: PLP-dependent transferase, partial [Candidatus Saccharicenans sp.]